MEVHTSDRAIFGHMTFTIEEADRANLWQSGVFVVLCGAVVAVPSWNWSAFLIGPEHQWRDAEWIANFSGLPGSASERLARASVLARWVLLARQFRADGCTA